jgi:hypothetical protein
MVNKLHNKDNSKQKQTHTKQQRDSAGRFMPWNGTRSWTKAPRPSAYTLDDLKSAYIEGMNSSKSGLYAPSKMFEIYLKNKGLL